MGIKETRVVESVLFSASQPVSVTEIMDATGFSRGVINRAIKQLIQTYNEDRKKDTAIEVVKAGAKYIMQVKQQYTDQSLKIAQPEIDDELLKTLTLIAFHQPVKQSNLRRMLGEKVYGHVDELVSMKLVHSKRYRSTEMLTTTKKFPEYFGIDSTKPDDIREFLLNKISDKSI